jgi:predicted aspartyl protease
LAIACREEKQVGGKQHDVLMNDSVAIPTPIATAPLVNPASEIESNSFEQALDKATSAFSISQSAKSPEDWHLVANQFREAIALMKRVPANSPYFPNAQTKIVEFERQLKYARRQTIHLITLKSAPKPKRIIVASHERTINPPLPQSFQCTDVHIVPNLTQCPPLPETQKLPPIDNLPPPEPLKQQQVFVAPITRRVGGTPVIEVTFNGNKRFEMILDTGASGTVITQKMAAVLGVLPVSKAKANTASSKAVEFPLGYVNSIEVGGAKVNQVAVAIASSDLETGLLGHDFFGSYDLTIKRDVVEFRPQSTSQIDFTAPVLKSRAVTKAPGSIEFP